MQIHQTAIVSENAEISKDVAVGPFSIIEGDVSIGTGTKIESNVVIASGTRIGKDCHVYPGAVIGMVPQDLKFGGEKTTVEIGNNTTIRECVTINRGTSARGKSKVGSDCLIMAYVHVAHDCFVGDNVILANAVNMAGHVTVDDFAIVGGMVPIHQFVRIGMHSFVGGGLRCEKDVPPYILAAGIPMKYAGLNSIGLRRRDFSNETRRALKAAYAIIYKKNLNVTQALEELVGQIGESPELKEVYDFFKTSERGVI